MTCTWPTMFSSPLLHSPKKEFGSDLFQSYCSCAVLWAKMFMDHRFLQRWTEIFYYGHYHGAIIMLETEKIIFTHACREVQLQDIYALMVLKDRNNSRRKKKLREEQHHSENDTTTPHPECRARVVCIKCEWKAAEVLSLLAAHLCLMMQEERLSLCTSTDNYPLKPSGGRIHSLLWQRSSLWFQPFMENTLPVRRDKLK